jgi:hypothetical protein
LEILGLNYSNPKVDKFKYKINIGTKEKPKWVAQSYFTLPDVDGIMILDRSLADKDALMEASMYETEENVDLITQSHEIHKTIHDY